MPIAWLESMNYFMNFEKSKNKDEREYGVGMQLVAQITSPASREYYECPRCVDDK